MTPGSNHEVRFGLIGYGLFGKHHASAIRHGHGTKLVAVAVRSAESQTAARADLAGVDVIGDYQQLLARPDIDVVDIVVPNRLHYTVAKAALAAGKHILLEKPMALSVAECDELNSLAARNGKLIAIGHELRLSVLWGRVKQLIDEGKIGRPQYCLIELSRFPYRKGSEGWRYDIEKVGNWILEEPIHFFDLAKWYLSCLGDPVSVYARANARDPQRPELQDNFSAIVNYPGGEYAVVSQALAAFGHHVSCKITGTTGAIWAYWSAADARSAEAQFSLTYGEGANVTPVKIDTFTGELVELQQEINAVAEAVRGGKPVPANGQDGRWSVLLCLAAQASVDRGAIVDLRSFTRQT
jgi:myo-inositol 2-dehydrogenase/D-chiro-inositol 1-dehydrogenase